jgi:hypothetical protein
MHPSCEKFSSKSRRFYLRKLPPVLPPLLCSVRKPNSRAIVPMELPSLTAGLLAKPYLDVLARMKERGIFTSHRQHLQA